MRVVVAMSGGVDSSAAAALLVEQGHEVLGITLRVWSYEGGRPVRQLLQPGRHRRRPRGGEHPRDPVLRRRCRGGLQGPGGAALRPVVPRRADPDALRGLQPGREVRLPPRRARALGARLATGHYARVERTDGRFRLRRAADAAKDQSYFLFTLGQDALARLVFPVGGLTKAEVRAVAQRHRLPTSEKPESMEISLRPRR